MNKCIYVFSTVSERALSEAPESIKMSSSEAAGSLVEHSSIIIQPHSGCSFPLPSCDKSGILRSRATPRGQQSPGFPTGDNEERMLHFQEKFMEQGGHRELLPFKLEEFKRLFLLRYECPPKDPEMGSPKLQAAPWLLLTLK